MSIPTEYRPDQLRTYNRALAGKLPAEVLTPKDRRLLVRQLVADGMTNREIAEHTRWTTYTTVRVRESIPLSPNQPRTESKAA
ncbi:hypothetical protein OHB12_23675 [Nocardia sp. NBC_01730]|uniref:hypothetical protein n=1 Tax=Nocardia sp. NBC_01730 TaxID=2975998 RepID=UPI002E0F110A|nr:hypothetical protein OHB12_23675 [Nocardia sp. NBC_01730]